jgi:hypothetical protein
VLRLIDYNNRFELGDCGFRRFGMVVFVVGRVASEIGIRGPEDMVGIEYRFR